MALRQLLGWSEGDLMNPDAKPCSKLLKHTFTVLTAGGASFSMLLVKLYYGPRCSGPRMARWVACGGLITGTTSTLLTRLLCPNCEPQNIDEYDS